MKKLNMLGFKSIFWGLCLVFTIEIFSGCTKQKIESNAIEDKETINEQKLEKQYKIAEEQLVGTWDYYIKDPEYKYKIVFQDKDNYFKEYYLNSNVVREGYYEIKSDTVQLNYIPDGASLSDNYTEYISYKINGDKVIFGGRLEHSTHSNNQDVNSLEYEVSKYSQDWKNVEHPYASLQVDDKVYSVGMTVKEFFETAESARYGYTYLYAYMGSMYDYRENFGDQKQGVEMEMLDDIFSETNVYEDDLDKPLNIGIAVFRGGEYLFTVCAMDFSNNEKIQLYDLTVCRIYCTQDTMYSGYAWENNGDNAKYIRIYSGVSLSELSNIKVEEMKKIKKYLGDFYYGDPGENIDKTLEDYEFIKNKEEISEYGEIFYLYETNIPIYKEVFVSSSRFFGESNPAHMGIEISYELGGCNYDISYYSYEY